MIYFITGNNGKFKEVKEIIPDILQRKIELPEIQELDVKKVIEQKIIQAGNFIDDNYFIEDGFFNLEALNNFPGPLIKWFHKSIGNNGIFDICKSFNEYKVTVGVMIGLKINNYPPIYFEGIHEGKIVEPRGTNGFDWDAIFLPNGQTKTYAEMSLEEKNNISMRKIAAEKLKTYLDSLHV